MTKETRLKKNYYFTYKIFISQESSFDFISFIPFIGLLIGGSIVIFFIFRKKNITFESFIYFKNKKIIPFFKPLVFGPLRLNINEDNVQKAEFYVNGDLKETITEPPFKWDFDKKGFMKTKIETKVFSKDGKQDSTGEMTFFVFNNRFLR